MLYLTWIFLASFIVWNANAQNAKIPVEKHCDFVVKLLKNLQKEASPNENIVCTPLSIAVPLTLAFEGSSGKTREDLREYLALSSADAQAQKENEQRAEILKALLDPKSLPISETRLASGIFVQKDVPLNKEFVEEEKKKFFSEVTNVDFSSNAEEIMEKLVSNVTKGRIPKLLSSKLNLKNQVVFVSALYFHGVWKDTMMKSQTKPGKFNTNAGEVEVQMMQDSKRVLYSNNSCLKFETIQLPFKKNDEHMMAFLLPYPDQSLSNVMDQIRGSDLQTALYNATKTSVEFKIPKMKVSGFKSLKSALSKEGLSSLFEKPELNKMTSAKDLTTIDFLHAAEIEIDEVGIKPGAGTPGLFPTFAIDFLVNLKPVIVNRPFAVVIYNRSTSCILSAALVYNPNAGAV